jgi:hypothetical protein
LSPNHAIGFDCYYGFHLMFISEVVRPAGGPAERGGAFI